MLRAAPKTTRAPRQSEVLDLGATPFTKGLLEPVASLAPDHSGGDRLPGGLQSLIFLPFSQKRVVMPPCAVCGQALEVVSTSAGFGVPRRFHP